MGMKILGVTGGIGAGKSSVCRILQDLGAIVIDADLLAREVVEPGKPAWNEIKSIYGDDVLLADSHLDRKKLAGIVFESEVKRRELEAIIHREVVLEMNTKLKQLKESGFGGVAVLDVPIPVKNGFLDTVDKVWVVTCNEEERIQRITRRSGLSREEAIKRIRAQLSQDEYIRLADEVIANDESHEKLKEKVIALYKKLME